MTNDVGPRGSSTGTLRKIRLPYLILIINESVDYMAQAVMILRRGKDITRAIGRVGLKVDPFLGSEIARATASDMWT